MTIKYDSLYVSLLENLNAIRLGEAYDEKIAKRLIDKGAVYYIGGVLFRREMLSRGGM